MIFVFLFLTYFTLYNRVYIQKYLYNLQKNQSIVKILDLGWVTCGSMP